MNGITHSLSLSASDTLYTEVYNHCKSTCNMNEHILSHKPPIMQRGLGKHKAQVCAIFFFIAQVLPSIAVRGQREYRSTLIYIYIYILENNLLLFWRANHPIIVKVWLKFGALVGYPLCAIVVLHFLMQFFIRKHVLFVDGNFPEIGNFIFVYFKFHRVSFIFPLMAFMFPQTQTSSYFLFPSFILFKIHNINAFGKLY